MSGGADRALANLAMPGKVVASLASPGIVLAARRRIWWGSAGLLPRKGISTMRALARYAHTRAVLTRQEWEAHGRASPCLDNVAIHGRMLGRFVVHNVWPRQKLIRVLVSSIVILCT